MKKYTNQSQEMRFVEFVDGTAQFLFRGQSITSDKGTKVVQKGIVVSDAVASKSTAKKTDTVSE
jgi:hypothetical protein